MRALFILLCTNNLFIKTVSYQRIIKKLFTCIPLKYEAEKN